MVWECKLHPEFPPKMAEFRLPVAGSGNAVRDWTRTETAPSGQATLPDTHGDLCKTEQQFLKTLKLKPRYAVKNA